MKTIAALPILAAVVVVASCGVSTTEQTPEMLTYNFIITVDRAKQDMLLVGPENEDIHIGVIGRKFYPLNETKRNNDKWPEGKWLTTVIPPIDPPHAWWDYELSLKPDGSVEFVEIENRQDYDQNFEPQGEATSRTRLSLSGQWKWSEGKGVLVFTDRLESRTD